LIISFLSFKNLNSLFIRCSLFVAIRTVVSVAEILKHRNYATIKSVHTSMIEDANSKGIAKLEIVLTRRPGVKEMIEKMRQEQQNETVSSYNVLFTVV
jgi:hypothetical protein